eukprot:4499903-Pyramimonas_sp.AAC.2
MHQTAEKMLGRLSRRHGKPLELAKRPFARYKVLDGKLYTTRDWDTSRTTKPLENLLVLSSLSSVMQRFQRMDTTQRLTLPDIDLMVGLMSGPPSYQGVLSSCARPGERSVSTPSFHLTDCWVERGLRDHADANHAELNHTDMFTLQSYLAHLRSKGPANTTFPGGASERSPMHGTGMFELP